MRGQISLEVRPVLFPNWLPRCHPRRGAGSGATVITTAAKAAATSQPSKEPAMARIEALFPPIFFLPRMLSVSVFGGKEQ